MRILFMLTIGGAAVFCDLYERRIPNPLITAGFLLGSAWQWSMKGPPGILYFLAGAALPLMLLGPLHFFKMLGAGDIKLSMVAGGFLGPWTGMKCVAFSFLIAAGISAGILLKHHILRQRLNYFVQYLQNYYENKTWAPYIHPEENVAYLHFSIPIVLSSLCMMGGLL